MGISELEFQNTLVKIKESSEEKKGNPTKSSRLEGSSYGIRRDILSQTYFYG